MKRTYKQLEDELMKSITLKAHCYDIPEDKVKGYYVLLCGIFDSMVKDEIKNDTAKYYAKKFYYLDNCFRTYINMYHFQHDKK